MEKPYMLSYDLDSPGQKYENVNDAIKNKISTGVWCKYLESTYLFRSTYSPSEMTDVLKPFLDNNDRLFIADISPASYSGWLETDEWEYIQKNIFKL